MKMYKRLLALLVVFSMMMVLPIFANAEEAAAVENEKYNSLVSKLSAIGIWSLEKNANDTITRQEFASLMADLLNADGTASADINFVDVDKNGKYYNDIAYLKSLGIMNGIDAERFAPLRTITYEEALKTMLTALGYGDRAEIKGGYPAGYISVGLSLGFKTNTGELTALEAAKMLDQAAFNVRLMTVIGYKADNNAAIIGPSGDTTVINEYHSIYKAKGKLTDNGLTELYKITSINPDDSMVKIDNEPFLYDGGADIRRALNSTLDYYYKEENGIKTLLWWEYAYANRTETVVYAEDILKDSPKHTKTNFVYQDKENDKTKSLAIEPRAAFIFNEIAFPTFTAEDLKPMEGWFTLVDEDGDKDIDIIFAEVYENYFVISESVNGEIFNDRFYRTLDTAKFDKLEIFDEQGADLYNDPANKVKKNSAYDASRQAGTPAKAVAANTVISVFKSKTDENGEGRYVKIILSDGTVTETLQSMVTEDDETIYTIGGKDYKMNDYISSQFGVDNSLAELRAGEKYRFYLDYRGEITYFEEMSAVNQYAYLLAAGKKSGGTMSKQAEMKLVLDTEEIVILPLADEVLYNGVKTSEIDVINSADIQKGAQLVRMKLNSKGEIRELNTAYSLCNTPLYKGVGYDPTKFNMVMEYSGTRPMGNNRFMFTSTNYAYDANTLFFYIPSSGREEDYRVYKGTSGADRVKGTYKVKGYDADNVLTLNAVTLTDMQDTAATDYGAYYSYAYIVTEVKGTTNIYGEDVKQIRTWCYDFEYNLIEDVPGVLPADVKPGDILRIQVNNSEKIVKADKLLSTMDRNGNPLPAEDRALPFGYTKNDKTKSKFTWGESILYGFPVGRNASGITIATGNPIGTRVNFIPFYVPGIVYFDVENLDCLVVDRTAIPNVATLDEENNRFHINNEDIAVLVTTSSSGMYDCIIIQY